MTRPAFFSSHHCHGPLPLVPTTSAPSRGRLGGRSGILAHKNKVATRLPLTGASATPGSLQILAAESICPMRPRTPWRSYIMPVLRSCGSCPLNLATADSGVLAQKVKPAPVRKPLEPKHLQSAARASVRGPNSEARWPANPSPGSLRMFKFAHTRLFSGVHGPVPHGLD